MTSFAARLARQRLAVASLFGIVGVVLGAAGYLQEDPPHSVLDAIYGGLQLVVLGGPVARVGGLPWTLQVGRFLAPAASGLAVVLAVMRLGTDQFDRRRARLARHHRVVFGDSDEARQLAHTTSTATRPQRRDRTVLIAALNNDDDDTTTLRNLGTIIVKPSDDRGTRIALHSAREVVVAHADDTDALRALERIESIIGAHRTGDRPDLRVLLRSTSMARSLRRRRLEWSSRTTSDDLWSSTAIVSIAELAALHLAGPTLLPSHPSRMPLHAVVIGRGEVATEVALALASRHGLRGVDFELDLFPRDDGSWTEEVLRRLSDRPVSISSYASPASGAAAGVDVARRCNSDERRHHVFLVGLLDGEAHALCDAIASTSSSIGVSVLWHRADMIEFGRSLFAENPSNYCGTVIPELLGLPDSLAVGIPDRLADAILDHLSTLCDVRLFPSDAPVLRKLFERSRAEQNIWALGLAHAFIDQLQLAGYGFTQQAASVQAHELPASVLLALRNSMKIHLATLDAVDPASLGQALRMTTELPERLRAIDINLIAPKESAQ